MALPARFIRQAPQLRGLLLGLRHASSSPAAPAPAKSSHGGGGPRGRGSGEYPPPVLSFSGPDAVLDVRVMAPKWEESALKQPGVLLLEFRPPGDGAAKDSARQGANSKDAIRFALRVVECGEVLVMDPEVGVRMKHDPFVGTKEGGNEVKTLNWSRAQNAAGIHVSVVHSHTKLGTTKNFSILLTPGELQLLREVMEHNIPAMLGFS
eukprot:EG_transcript_23048